MTEGMILVTNLDPLDLALDRGTKVGEIHSVVAQTTVCANCGNVDTEAWCTEDTGSRCLGCRGAIPEPTGTCAQCGSAELEAMSYQGCVDCKPENKKKRHVYTGALGRRNRQSALTCMALCSVLAPKTDGCPNDLVSTITHPASHIIEEPGAVEHLTEVAYPPESYYKALSLHMRAKHPKASVHILEHVASLDVLLDTSILSGFSYGAAKAEIAVISGTLLGHQVGRNGASCSPDRTDARNFRHLRRILTSDSS